MRLLLNWLERLATDQEVLGSTPSRRTIKKENYVKMVRKNISSNVSNIFFCFYFCNYINLNFCIIKNSCLINLNKSASNQVL